MDFNLLSKSKTVFLKKVFSSSVFFYHFVATRFIQLVLSLVRGFLYSRKKVSRSSNKAYFFILKLPLLIEKIDLTWRYVLRNCWRNGKTLNATMAKRLFAQVFSSKPLYKDRYGGGRRGEILTAKMSLSVTKTICRELLIAYSFKNTISDNDQAWRKRYVENS